MGKVAYVQGAAAITITPTWTAAGIIDATCAWVYDFASNAADADVGLGINQADSSIPTMTFDSAKDSLVGDIVIFHYVLNPYGGPDGEFSGNSGTFTIEMESRCSKAQLSATWTPYGPMMVVLGTDEN